MEDKEAALEALKGAERWLGASQTEAGDGNYDIALYGLEMAVEIALKAVMLSLGADVPKIHDIRDAVAKAVKGDGRVPEEFVASLDEITIMFKRLLDLRQVSGYTFEAEGELRKLEAEYNGIAAPAKKAVSACEKAVHSVSGKGRR